MEDGAKHQEYGGPPVSEGQFLALFQSSHRRFVQYANTLLRDESLAEDVVSDVLVSILQRVRSGGGPSEKTFVSYMRVCIRNESINASKRQSKELPSDDLQVLVEQDQIIDLTSDLTSTRDNEAAVKAYQALTTRAQQVLYFSEVEDKSLADIAKELNISEQNVATAASRARDTLRTNYLIETVSDLPGCETVKIQYLALHARGKSPRLRHSRIEQHLKTCDSCQKRLKRMTSLRLPVSAILGLATTGEFVRLSALSPSAGQASNAYSQRETSLIANEQRRSVGLRLGLPVAAGIVVAAMSFQGVNPISGDDSPSSVLHQKNEDDSLNETAAAKNRDAGAAPAARPAATIDSSSPSATHDPSVEDPSVNPPNSDPPNSDPPDTDPPPELPQGVRSVEWVKKPQTYARGGARVKLELRVVFEPGINPTGYRVTVAPPRGVSLVDASASCSMVVDEAVCVPDANMLELEAYRLQFLANLAANADLPRATIQSL